MTPLVPPPEFAYRSRGPWLVTQEEKNGKGRSVLVYDLHSAVVKFWVCDTFPWRRVLVDSRGVTILGMFIESDPGMVGTKESCETLLALMSEAPLDHQGQALWLVEQLREGSGVVV